MKAKIFTLLMAMVLCISNTPNVALAAETTGIENIEDTLATEKLPVDAELMYTTVNYGSLTNYYLTDVTVNLNGNNVKSARIKISSNSGATYGCTVTTPDGKTHTKTFAGNGKEYTVWSSLFSQSGKFTFHIYMYDGSPKTVTANFKITK